MADIEPEAARADKRRLARKIDTIGWGVFLIWVGVAVLADVGWGFGLLGVGIIALGEQAVRRSYDLHVERFGLLVGILFAVAGGWELLKVQWGTAPLPGGLLPILAVVAGVVLVVSAWVRKPRV
jgi:hypothetical protein